MKKLTLMCITLLVVSCNAKKANEKQATQFAKIDLDKRFDKKAVNTFLDKISDIRLVPLETNDESITDVSKIYTFDKKLFILDGEHSAILQFDKNGKFINKLSKKGQGAEEYNFISDFFVFKDEVYILNNNRILRYDLKGNYIKTTPVTGIESPYNLLIKPNGDIVVTGGYYEDYYIHIFDNEGNKKEEYFPRQEMLSNLNRRRHSYEATGFYNEGIYFSQYFDTRIHYLKDGTIETLYDFNFGTSHIPEEFYSTPADKQFDVFEDLKYRTVMSFAFLTLTNNWIVFGLEHWRDNSTIYYDRRTGQYINNHDFPYPYSVLFGYSDRKRTPPCYANGEFFFRVESFELIELISGLRDKGILSQYKFLENIDTKNTDEEDNPFVLFYKLK